MQLNWQDLVGKTELKNKKCVAETLDSLGVKYLEQLDNLPGTFSRPWLCGNPTNNVVIELRKAMVTAAEEVPTIDEVIEALPEPEEPERAIIGASTPVIELEIENVAKRQLAAIAEAGIGTVGELFEQADALEEVPGIGEATKLRILEAVTEVLENQ